MTGISKTSGALVVAALGAAAGIASIAGAGFAHSETDRGSGRSYCEVLASGGNGSFVLEAVYHADAATSGTYQFSVQSAGGPGRTDINQGGGFSANANETIVLGTMNLGGSSAYDVSLAVTADGVTHECGGRLNG